MEICALINGDPAGEHDSGATVVDVEFLKFLNNSNHLGQVIAPRNSNIDRGSFPNIKWIDCGQVSSGAYLKYLRPLRASLKLIDVYKANPKTVFRVNSFFGSILPMLPLQIYARGQVRYFVQFHHKDFNRLRNYVVRSVLQRAKVIICPSDAAIREVRALVGNSGQAIFKISHGVRNTFLDSDIDKGKASSKLAIRLLFIGRLEPRKNPELLLDIVERLYKTTKFSLQIVGDGPLKQKMLQNCKGQPWSKSVSFIDKISEEDKIELYSKSDVFVFPSTQEGFGIVLAEAMASGVAVVGFNTSAMPEVVEKGAGFLFPVGDVDACTKCLVGLDRDRDLLSKTKEKAHQHAREEFKWEDKMKNLFDLLDGTFT
jgi:glycosyltransferase involved in cell wall biosynthesis